MNITSIGNIGLWHSSFMIGRYRKKYDQSKIRQHSIGYSTFIGHFFFNQTLKSYNN